MLVILLCFSVVSLARDYFVMNLEHGTVQTSTNDPDILANYSSIVDSGTVIPAHNPGEHLVLSLPYEYAFPEKTDVVVSDIPKPEKGALYQIHKDGTNQQLIELGYARFVKALSSDQKQLLISYHVEPQTTTFELAYYNIETNQISKLPLDNITEVYDIKFSPTDSVAYLLGLDSEQNHIIATINLLPLTIKSRYILGPLPIPHENLGVSVYSNLSEIYVLKNNLLAIVNYSGGLLPNNSKGVNNKTANELSNKLPGSVTLLDIQKQMVIKQVPLLEESYPTWFPNLKKLVIATRTINGTLDPLSNGEDAEWMGEGSFIKIDEQGIKTAYTPLWFDYQYNASTDQVHYLAFKDMGSFNFKDGKTQQWTIGRNTYTLREGIKVMTSPDLLNVLNDGKIATCTNLKNGKIRIVDLVNNKIIAQLKGSPLTGDMLGNKDGKTLITSNSNQTKYYVMQSKSVQVYNNSIKLISTIDLPENSIGMYQINPASPTTLIVTNHNIYHIDDDKLVSVIKVKERVINIYFLKEGDSFSILAGNEWLYFNPMNGMIKSLKTFSKSNDLNIKFYMGHLKERKIQLRPE